MTKATPVVSGKRVILPAYRKNIVLGEFSCHRAAVVAYVRLMLDRRFTCEDEKPKDLEKEPAMRALLTKIWSK